MWQRALVVAGGPFANFVLAIFIFTLLFTLVGVELRPARVVQVQANSPAAAAGFLPGDLITRVNGKLIADVALAAGFADQAHFQRAFKQHFAATPGQYRDVLKPSANNPHWPPATRPLSG